MKYSWIIWCLVAIMSTSFSQAQDYVSVKEELIVLSNEQLTREIALSENKISSVRLSMFGLDRNYIQSSREFAFLLNGQAVDGSSGWMTEKIEIIEDERSGHGVRVILQGRDSLSGLHLEINYLLYPDLPLVRKWIGFKNTGSDTLNIEEVNVEDLQTDLSHVLTLVHHNYARMKHIGRFVGEWDDPVRLHSNRPTHPAFFPG